ncbi:DUF4446 family protein [Patescibacteria group bacterium]|nr:DUF4446 family protein [Patescibacteria group bacterium]
MYPDWVGSAILAGIVIWLGSLSFLIRQQDQFLRSLFPKSGSRDIRKKFEETVKEVEGFKRGLNNLDGKLEKVASDGLGYIQRVELLRFNPYDDTGGDQSFTACLLDNKGSGIVITSLHARSGTRIFAKSITMGKSGKYRLSKEEEQVLKKALNNG